MFEHLKTMPEDKILGLNKLFRADERNDKIDLGVGVYKDAHGNTPIMRAVKNAERQLLDVETTKSYTGLIGDGGFHKVMADLILGDTLDADRFSFAHTPGGTGAVHQILQLIKASGTGAKIWLSNPSWPNHASIIHHLGLERCDYRYFNSETRSVDFDGMMTDLDRANEGDVVILHGCCHNPTGANLNASQWQAVCDLLAGKKLIPFIDIAYQGFGDGLDEDAFGTRLLARTLPNVVIAASCSKNFGIYRERCGLVIALSEPGDEQKRTQGNLAHLNRQNFSFPPDHGARLVTMVMMDEALRSDWQAELTDIREGMIAIRKELASSLQELSGSDRFGFLAEHRGMFSRLGATKEQIMTLREKYGIYMIDDSRMNIAGISQNNVSRLAQAFIDVGV